MGKSGKEHKAKFDTRQIDRNSKHGQRFTQQPQAKKKAA